MKNLLLNQFKDAWALGWYHLQSLTTDECLWRPASQGSHLFQGTDGVWRGTLPERETYDVGPASSGWISWHWLFWWEMAINHNFGDQTLEPERINWPGSADALRERLLDLSNQWIRLVEGLDDADLVSTDLCRWPFKGKALGTLLAWANMELTKNAAELGYTRFLYHARRPVQRP